MLYSIVGILVIIIDQAVKFWVSNTLFGTDIVKFIPGVISLVNIHNEGAAFGFLSGSVPRIYFIVVTGVFVLLVVLALATNFISGKLSRWSLVLVAAGALGNMIDRIIYGYVQDMFKVELFNFAIFNVADVFITVFAIIFALAMIFEKPEDDEEELYEDDEEEEEEEKPRKKLKAARKAKAAEEEEEAEEAPAPKQSAVRTNRKARQDKYEKEYEEYKAQQRAAMRREAESQSAPAPAPAQDPFAAWEQANARVEASRDDSYAGRVMERPQKAEPAPAQPAAEKPARRQPREAAVRPVETPKPQPAPKPAEAPKPAPAPAPAAKPAESMDFDLDDILAEFK